MHTAFRKRKSQAVRRQCQDAVARGGLAQTQAFSRQALAGWTVAQRQTEGLDQAVGSEPREPLRVGPATRPAKFNCTIRAKAEYL